MSQAAKRARISGDMEIAKKAIGTIRVLAATCVQQANSGHPGAPMGMAHMAYLMWSEIMNYSPSDPHWFNRDRFVLSNGHACALQYTMLHLTGYKVTMDDLRAFRQLDSITPGHPERGITEGIEVSTGPLGQGISNAVGMAVAEKHLAAKFNTPEHKIIDHFTYVFCGDGCLQEGVSSEASSLAGHLGLGKLIVLYDDNSITIDGETSLSFSEDVVKRYEAYGWHTQTVPDFTPDDLSSLREAVFNAQQETSRPSLIKVRTIIGVGAKLENTAKVHGSPLGDEDLASVMAKNGFTPDQKFFVPEDVSAHFAKCKELGDAAAKKWGDALAAYTAANPAKGAELTRLIKGELPKDWEKALPTFATETMATRKFSEAVLKKLVPAVPEFFGGSADLTPSNNTRVEANSTDFSAATPEGNYFRFGVREHGMAAICNGLAAHGGIIPFGATFLVFAGYALGAMRLASLSHLQVVYILTHDSIGLGEDGPTHQPVETLATLRAIPNMAVFRPADGNETSAAYKYAISHRHGPTTIALSRQNCTGQKGSSIEGALKGAYVLADAASPKVVLAGTGSEVQLLTEAAAELAKKGVAARVVSFPCFELFEAQPLEYQQSVFPPGVPVLSVEAGVADGWHKFSHGQIAMTSFGTSAPAEQAFEKFGFTASNIVDKAQKLVAFYKGAAPNLLAKPF